MGAAKHKRMLEAGARAPEFELKDVAGHNRGLRELLNSGPVVLAFFKITCPVCQYTFPFLDRIHREAPPGALSIYGISQDDAESSNEFNREFGVSFPTLLDSEDSGYPASNAYRISYVPSAFQVEHDGSISWTMEGFDRKALESLASKVGVRVIRPGERVPDYRPG